LFRPIQGPSCRLTDDYLAAEPLVKQYRHLQIAKKALSCEPYTTLEIRSQNPPDQFSAIFSGQ